MVQPGQGTDDQSGILDLPLELQDSLLASQELVDVDMAASQPAACAQIHRTDLVILAHRRKHIVEIRLFRTLP